MVVCMLLLAHAGFSQDPGDNPDGPPPAVPFEDYVPLILLVAGSVFALFTIKKLQKSRLSKNNLHFNTITEKSFVIVFLFYRL